MAQKQYENIIYEKKEKVAIVTLNRPKALNALNSATLAEVHDSLKDAESDKNIQVIVLTGSGDRAFSAGADISEIQHLSPLEAVNYALSAQTHHRFMESLKKPILAKINGFCLGGGLELALACDFRIASDKSRFSLPEVNLALIPGAGGTQRLVRLIGKTKAMELDMLGSQIDANEAYRLGLINQVVPAEELDKTVDEFVQKLLSKSPATLEIIKRVVNNGINMDLDRALYYEAQCFGASLATEDAKEGIKAFVEKRKPEFKGK